MVNFRSHLRDHVHRRHGRRHLPGSHRHHHPGRVHDVGLNNRRRLGSDCHHRTGCSAASGRPTAAAIVAGHRGAAIGRPGIRHHHRSEATASGAAVGASARVAAAAATAAGRRLDSLGWARRRTGSAAGEGSGFTATGSTIAVRLGRGG